MEENKDKRAKFEEIAGRRVQAIIDTLDKLSNCSNTKNYVYSEQDVKKMMATIKEKVRFVEVKFNEELKKKSKNSTFKF